MALSAEEKKRYEDVIDLSAGPRNNLLSARSIPAEYRAQLDDIDREERIFEFPDIVPVRVVISRCRKRSEKCPLHINMHGGGFYIPQNEDDDLYCANLAEGVQGILVDIDYATTHNYPFPVAFEQCYAVTKWAYEHARELGADEKKISVGGLSAGGNLAAAVALRAAATREMKLCLAILDCAATDCSMAITSDESDRMAAFSKLYCDGNIRMLKMPYCSPAYATDMMLKGMPKTLVVAAGACPFKQVNERFAGRLAAAGVEVSIKTFRDSHHGFVVRMIDEWRSAQDTIVRYINESSL